MSFNQDQSKTQSEPYVSQYDTQTMDQTELEGDDTKVTPDQHINRALFSLPQCLLKENMRDGFLQYIMMTEWIETLCYSAKKLDDDYQQKVNELNNAPDLQVEKDALIKGMKISNKKLRIMLTSVFDSRLITASFKF